MNARASFTIEGALVFPFLFVIVGVCITFAYGIREQVTDNILEYKTEYSDFDDSYDELLSEIQMYDNNIQIVQNVITAITTDN